MPLHCLCLPQNLPVTCRGRYRPEPEEVTVQVKTEQGMTAFDDRAAELKNVSKARGKTL